MIALLSEAMGGRRPDDRADTLYSEWRRSLEVVYGNLDDEESVLADTLRETFDLSGRTSLGELLFVVHTYFALIVRLVAIEVLGVSAEDEASQPTTWSSLADPQLVERLRAIDAGTIPPNLEIQNLFEGDVFSWYLDSLDGNVDLLNCVRELLDTLDTFALPRVAYGANRATDVLRDLYLHWCHEHCKGARRVPHAALARGRLLGTCPRSRWVARVWPGSRSHLRHRHILDARATRAGRAPARRKGQPGQR